MDALVSGSKGGQFFKVPVTVHHRDSRKSTKPSPYSSSSPSRPRGFALVRERVAKFNEEVFSAQSKIQFLFEKSIWFDSVPDVGMDRFLVTDGTPIGTGGLGPCFAICMIGKSQSGPVLGLCHTSSMLPFRDVQAGLRGQMVVQKGAIDRTIETYVVGGVDSCKENPRGALDEEFVITKPDSPVRIRGGLFNQVSGDNEEEGLTVVLTSEKIYVSKNPLFPVTGAEDGEEL